MVLIFSSCQAYLGKKLKDAEELVLKATDQLEAPRPDPNRIRDLRQGLKNLKLHELEVDVTSTQIALQKELTILRSAADQGVLPQQSASTSPVTVPTNSHANPSPETTKMIATLEADNHKLRELLKEAQKELSAKTTVSPPPPPVPTVPTVPLSEVQRYKEEIELLKDQIMQLNSQMADRDQQLEEVQRSQRLSQNEAVQKLQQQLQQAEQEKAKALKAAEAQHAKAMADLEASFATEREEMEQALAEELEEMERNKDNEIKTVQTEVNRIKGLLHSSQQAQNTLQSALKRVADNAARIKRDYRLQARETGKELADFATSIRTVFSASFVHKIKVCNSLSPSLWLVLILNVFRA